MRALAFRQLAFLLFALLSSALLPAHAQAGIGQFDFGGGHRCWVDAGGVVDCLGESNDYGQIGNGSSDTGAVPRPVRVIARGARQVATGNSYTCAVVGDAMQCWGDIPPRKGGTRKPVTLIEHGVSAIAVGRDRACAIVGAAVQCVGMGGGSGSASYLQAHPTPETVIERGASAVAAGDGFACAVADGALWCWGDNNHGQVGIPAAENPFPKPSRTQATEVVDGEQCCFIGPWSTSGNCRVGRLVEVVRDGVEFVTAKESTTCAIVRGGALLCWGQNDYGQLGIASGGEDVPQPTVAIARGVGYAATAGAGVRSRTCALVDGALQCSRPCAWEKGKPQCPPEAGFDARDLPFGLSALEARLGVWSGTIGTRGVMVCLPRGGDEAAYYYTAHGATIALAPEQNTDGVAWTEHGADAAVTGTWALDLAQGNTLTGQWSDPAGQRHLPIRLKRVPTPGDPGQGCAFFNSFTPAGRAWNAPRAGAKKVGKGSWNDKVRTLSVPGSSIKAIELADDMPGAQSFNAAVRRWMHDEIVNWYEGVSGYGRPQHLVIEWRADPWLVVRQVDSYSGSCRADHPSGCVIGYWVWNLVEGRRVEPWNWIVTAGRRNHCPDHIPHCEQQPTDRLNKLIAATAKRNHKSGDGCDWDLEDYRNNGTYKLRPDAEGLVFRTDFYPTPMQVCDEDIRIPWSKLAPFLTAEGRKAMRSMQEAAARARP